MFMDNVLRFTFLLKCCLLQKLELLKRSLKVVSQLPTQHLPYALHVRRQTTDIQLQFK